MAADTGSPVPVLVFTRTPVPGKVKTRLIPAIGAERAANLHRAMLWRTAATASGADVGPVSLWCNPSGAHPFIDELARAFGLDVREQQGADLGERMHHALEAETRRGGGAILVGTDCPFLQADDLQQAAAALGGGTDAAIGPAEDGGYYLIGVRTSRPSVFEGVAWGSGQVLDDTLQRFRALGWRWHALEKRRDVDRPADLEALADLLIY